MKNNNLTQRAEDYRRIEKAIRFVEANYRRQPDLDEIAEAVHLSKYHFHRMFKRWAGISPQRFMQFLTLDYAKQRLAESKSVLDTTFDAGLSGPGRLHDLFVTFEAMTPGEFKRLGADLEITYGYHATPFGECLLAMTERGICSLGFVQGDRTEALDRLRRNWPQARLIEAQRKTGRIVKEIFRDPALGEGKPFHLLLKGTNFQANVWRALLTIPRSLLVSYADLAGYLGMPAASRAVAGAVAVNPVAYLIPCHRVIAKSGHIHKYRWGELRKRAILGYEAAIEDCAPQSL